MNVNKTQVPVLRFANRVGRLHASPIRDILSVIDRPGMTSFAGGLPSPESLPALGVAEISPTRLQYGASEGDADLRALVATELQQRGLGVNPQRVLILSGSQQGIDLVAKLFVEPGTTVSLEQPTYLAALQVFSLFGASYQFFDPACPRVGDFQCDNQQPVSLCYAIPTFQNPAGHCYRSLQRVTLARAVDRSGVVFFEDDPYRDLVYEDCDRTPVCSMLKRAPWIYQSSFSKSLAPGLRLGYLTASESIFPMLVRAKQAADLHTNRVSQQLAAALLVDRDACQSRLQRLCAQYAVRRDCFDDLLQRYFSDIAQWRLPAGGLFFWLELNATPKRGQSLDTRRLLQQAIDRNVAFMPGEPFYADQRDCAGRLRLNFSHASERQMQSGLKTLAQLVRRALD